MCGPFALACGGGARGAVPWHAGRLVTYALLGAGSGALGQGLTALPAAAGWVAPAVSAALIVWFAGALAGVAPEPAVVVPGLGRMARRVADGRSVGARFAFGLANGLLPCGLVYAA
ncbi:MAG: sulfite exporter TauE/SafE family protein, partial [Gemmatimonadetes bacterium]